MKPNTIMLNRKQTDREIFQWLLDGKTLIDVSGDSTVPTEIKMVDDYIMIINCWDPSRRGTLMFLPDLNPYQWTIKND